MILRSGSRLRRCRKLSCKLRKRPVLELQSAALVKESIQAQSIWFTARWFRHSKSWWQTISQNVARCAALQPRNIRRAKVRNRNGTALIHFRSLKYRIAATIFVLEAIVLAAVLWQSHQLSFSLSQQEQMVKANIMQTLLSESSRNALFDYEFGTLQTLLERACGIGPLERALTTTIAAEWWRVPPLACWVAKSSNWCH